MGFAPTWLRQVSPLLLSTQQFDSFTAWGTVIRGLMRGMATLHQGNQELLMVKKS